MKTRHRSPSICLHRAILGIAALLVPRRERREWWTEWTTELWYLVDADRSVTRFCLGAFHDAVWLRLNGPRPEIDRLVSSRSPVLSLAFLALLTAGSVLLAFRLPSVSGVVRQQPVLAHVLDVLVALLILPSTTRLDMGDYPVGGHSPARAQRVRRWTFLGAKFALIVPAVFFGTLDLIPIIAPAGLQPLAALVGYILAFRWALTDQRRRCPVCLRLLSNPVRIGQPSHIFLEWYGTELMCSRGHGLLHIPEMPTISCRTQRWLSLDESWRSLFS